MWTHRILYLLLWKEVLSIRVYICLFICFLGDLRQKSRCVDFRVPIILMSSFAQVLFSRGIKWTHCCLVFPPIPSCSPIPIPPSPIVSVTGLKWYSKSTMRWMYSSVEKPQQQYQNSFYLICIHQLASEKASKHIYQFVVYAREKKWRKSRTTRLGG